MNPSPIRCPMSQLGWLAAKWAGVRLLVGSAPPAKWGALAAYGDYLEEKKLEFFQVSWKLDRLVHQK